jgi:hypothetical protein
MRNSCRPVRMTPQAYCLLSIFSVLFFLAAASPVYADAFQFTFTGTGINGVLDVTATSQGSGTFLATSISGTVNGNAVTGLIAPTALSGYSDYTLPDGDFYSYDDLLFPSATPPLDLGGLLFTVVGESQPVNLWDTTYGVYIGGGNYPNDFVDTPVTFSAPVPVPEPPTLLLLFASLLTVGAVLFWKQGAVAVPNPLGSWIRPNQGS